jgi:DMSO/TMAO reductase YedYZ molybdopterin-dependent catalytic subunit
MSSAALDRLLALLVIALAVTGLATLRAGNPSLGWVFGLHGVLAGSLTIAVVVKLRRSLPRALSARRFGRLGLALVVTLVAAVALSGGWLWASSGDLAWLAWDGFGSFTILTLHAWAGLALVPVIVLHLIPRRWRLLVPAGWLSRRDSGRPRMAPTKVLTRRSLLVGAGFAAAGFGAVALAAIVEAARDGARRFTGSRWLRSGTVPPATTFFGEPAPPVDEAAWRVDVSGTVGRPGTFGVAQLRSIAEVDMTAVLDCTSGWAVETTWRGLPVAMLLDAVSASPSAREVVVRSATGWTARFSPDEARRCLLAWSVAGQRLPAGNGAPLRLVVPDRRGLWVKWVSRIEVS